MLPKENNKRIGGAGKGREGGRPRAGLETKSQPPPDTTGEPWKTNYISEFLQMQSKGAGLPETAALAFKCKRTQKLRGRHKKCQRGSREIWAEPLQCPLC